MKRSLSLIVFLFASTLAFSQETGSFQESVTFSETDYSATRTLYYYVPSDYDANLTYKLVVGFRGGPNSNAGQFRDQLTFLSDSLDAIILCPENEAHFWNEEGLTKQLFQYSVARSIELYPNIDQDYIYLTGLSYGGRHAVIVSMDTDDGSIPSLRGVIPFAAGSDSQLQPNYESVSDFPPACICIGLDDSSTFINVANTLHDDIQTNGGASVLNEIPDVGHTADFPTFPEEMMECFAFIESQYAMSVSEEDFAAQVLLFPNPAQDKLTFSFPKQWEPQSIEVLSAEGKLIQVVSGQTVDTSNLQPGMYSLVITTLRKRVTSQFSVVR